MGRRNWCSIRWDEKNGELLFDIRVERQKGLGETVWYTRLLKLPWIASSHLIRRLFVVISSGRPHPAGMIEVRAQSSGILHLGASSPVPYTAVIWGLDHLLSSLLSMNCANWIV